MQEQKRRSPTLDSLLSSSALGDFLSGTAAGVASRIVDHPFDTVKVRLQTGGAEFTSSWQCIRRIWALDGIRGFYRGLGAPVSSAAFIHASVFLTVGRVRNLYAALTGISADHVSAFCASGACGGLVAATFATPMELVKCRVQHQLRLRPTERVYSGVVDCVRKTWAREGVVGFFAGHTATMARAVPGNASWFFASELTVKLFIPEGGSKTDCPWYAFPISGSVGGLSYWTAGYPIDMVKTRMQTDAAWRQAGLLAGIRRVCRESGVRALYAGYEVTAVRCLPVSATTYTVFSKTQTWWNSMKP